MARYLAQRVGQAILVVWLAYTLVFLAVQLLPSDPVTIFLTADSAVDQAAIDTMKSQYGYDQPLLVQYLNQLVGVLSGNFGYSLASGQSVLDRISGVAGSTVALAGSAFIVAGLMAVIVVAAATLTRSAILRRVLVNLPPLLAAVPVFWLGLVLLDLLSIRWGVMSLFPDGSVLSLAIPVLVLAAVVSAPLAQVLLKSMNQVYDQPFIDVLRAKGASRSWIFFRHALKNAAGPALTVMGITVGTLFAGSVITETVFARSGLGSVVLTAVTTQDVPLVQGLVLLTASVFVVVNLVVDLLYPLLDPRILKSNGQGAPRALTA
ncbi:MULTISPECIES: ABC transporter permease [unclassified Arthrobacter]|uniref:ABC transporter permease n=1 Tax=unclassified Arthrobacter TaxID=235627 RepID=UPI001492B866|nr:ABC transporter permease [Arthrobacter sp. AET 35A]MBE0010643.1 ABC transporter permease [Arthrobacter sp. AET 35A]NOJ64504.1 ABC transporter permease [Arthrobacter sp. 147(2020)]